mgnify:CR=1 FL=1
MKFLITTAMIFAGLIGGACLYCMYLSIPYDQWVELQRRKRINKQRRSAGYRKVGYLEQCWYLIRHWLRLKFHKTKEDKRP